MREIHLWVPGPPATAGSKTAFRTKTGKINVTHANKKFRSWSYELKAAAQAEYKEAPCTCSVTLSVRVALMRPNGHYGTGRNAGTLKASAPLEHTQRPDLCKIIRAVEDSLTGVIWRDDSQINEYESCMKEWCSATFEQPGTAVTVKLWE